MQRVAFKGIQSLENSREKDKEDPNSQQSSK